MSEPIPALETYMSAWNEDDPARRNSLLKECWEEGAIYCDPMSRTEGRDALSAMIGVARERFPGCRLAMTSEVDGHHDCLRFEWALIEQGGIIAIEGIDFVTVAPSGKLSSVTGFFGILGKT